MSETAYQYGHGPASCGSDAACAVLQALNTFGGPATRRDIESLTGLSPYVLTEALRGVRERGLASPHGRGSSAKWVLTRWAKEDRPDVLRLIGASQS